MEINMSESMVLFNRTKRWFEKFKILMSETQNEPEYFHKPNDNGGLILTPNIRVMKIRGIYRRLYEETIRQYLAKDDNGNYINAL